MIAPNSLHRLFVPWSRWFCLATIVTLLFSASRSHAGAALRLYYPGIKGDDVADFMAHPSFPAKPTTAEPLIWLLSRVERGEDNWGTWIRAYLEAPQTGEYTFFLASDNGSEFWLSTTHEPFQVRKVMENTNVTARLDYRVQSEPIQLVQGQKYYFELYHKEGIGVDHVSVAWRLPDGTLESPIPSLRFMPVPVNDKYEAVDKAPIFLRDYFGRLPSALTNTVATGGETTVLAPTVEGSQPITFQWFKNDKIIPGANLSSLTLTDIQINQSGEVYRVTASNHLGVATAQGNLTVVPDVKTPSVISAVSRGALNTIAVFFSKALDPATAVVPGNYELSNGAKVQKAKLLSESTVVLTATALTEGKSFTLKVKNVKDVSRRNAVSNDKPLPVDEGLYVWLRFDNKTDDLVPDSSGNYNDAVLMNGAALKREGVFGYCVEFDGVDDHAVLPTGFANFTNGMTVALWAKPTGKGHWARFIDLGNGPARETILLAREFRTDNLVFEAYQRELMKVIAPDVLESDKWQHLAATMNSKGEVSIYKNGQLTKKGNTNIPIVAERTINLIGRSNWDADGYYKGSMDDLRIYERTLNGDEIRAIAEGPAK